MQSEFHGRLYCLIMDRGLTASELSRLSGVGKADISNYINGKYLPKQDKLLLLAKALDVDPGWLMTGIEQTSASGSDTGESIRTVEARTLARGVDKMPPAQREAIMKMMMGLYPGLFEKGEEENDT